MELRLELAMGNDKLRRITELFERGDLVEIGKRDDGTPEFIWVQKLNSFEYDEATKDGRYARGLRMEALKRDEKEQAVLNDLVGAFSDEELVQLVLDERAPEMMQRANAEVRSLEGWQDRLAVLDRQQLGTASSEEAEALEALNREFGAEVRKVYERMVAQERTDMLAQAREEREVAWRDAYYQRAAATEFMSGFRQTEVFYALRDVEVELVDGEWQPKAGVPKPRLLSDRDEVRDLPDGLLDLVLEALQRQMTQEQAGNSDAPSASSEPSERPVEQEGSKRSGRAATSRRPAGTSSTQSPKR